MKRAALYVRVSTIEQRKHGLSVDNQIVALTDYCKENGYTIAGIYNDAGISARKAYSHRPALLQLIKDCEEKKVDVILFTKLDRWFRSVADYYEVQKHLDACKVPWRAIWEDYETETSSGVFKVNIMLSVAQSEADRTSERIKSVMEYKRSQGHALGKVLHGYKRVNGILEIDEEAREEIEFMFSTYFETLSIRKTALAMLDQGYRATKTIVQQRLQNPTYAGTTPQGIKCPAYITEAQHAIIKSRAAEYRRTRTNSGGYIFSGMLVCGVCGGRLAPAKTNGYVQYNCNGMQLGKPHPYISVYQKKLEGKLLESIADLLDKYMVSSVDYEQIKRSDEQIKKLRAKLDRLSVLYEDGDISTEEYRRKRDVVKADIDAIVSHMPKQIDFTLPDEWETLYNSLDPENRKVFWNTFIKSIRIKKEERYDIALDDITFIC